MSANQELLLFRYDWDGKQTNTVCVVRTSIPGCVPGGKTSYKPKGLYVQKNSFAETHSLNANINHSGVDFLSLFSTSPPSASPQWLPKLPMRKPRTVSTHWSLFWKGGGRLGVIVYRCTFLEQKKRWPVNLGQWIQHPIFMTYTLPETKRKKHLKVDAWEMDPAFGFREA